MLEELELTNTRIEDLTSLASDSTSLPQLQTLRCNSLGSPTLAVLCSIRDIPPRASIRIEVSLADFSTISGSPEFQRRFCPLDIERIHLAHSSLTYIGNTHSPGPTFTIATQLGYASLSNWTSFYTSQLIDPRILRSKVINTLQLITDIQLPGANEHMVPIAQLPPSKTIEVNTSTAPLLFDWLQKHTMDVRAHEIECLVFEHVGLKTLDPRAPLIRSMLAPKELTDWKAQHQTFTNLDTFLRTRYEAGHPIKLALRRGLYDDDVVERLRAFVHTLEIESACMPFPVPPTARPERPLRSKKARATKS